MLQSSLPDWAVALDTVAYFHRLPATAHLDTCMARHIRMYAHRSSQGQCDCVIAGAHAEVWRADVSEGMLRSVVTAQPGFAAAKAAAIKAAAARTAAKGAPAPILPACVTPDVIPLESNEADRRCVYRER